MSIHNLDKSLQKAFYKIFLLKKTTQITSICGSSEFHHKLQKHTQTLTHISNPHRRKGHVLTLSVCEIEEAQSKGRPDHVCLHVFLFDRDMTTLQIFMSQHKEKEQAISLHYITLIWPQTISLENVIRESFT